MTVPDKLRDRYAAWSWSLVQEWPGESVTWRVQSGDRETHFVKVARFPRYPSLVEEEARLRWVRSFVPVPDVLESGTENHLEWLVTAALVGKDLTNPVADAAPEDLVRRFAEALRLFHDAAPVAQCPFDFTLDVAMHHARTRVETGVVIPDRDFHPEHLHLSAIEALRQLERLRPDHEDRVVCHGDYCPPNVLMRLTQAS